MVIGILLNVSDVKFQASVKSKGGEFVSLRIFKWPSIIILEIYQIDLNIKDPKTLSYQQWWPVKVRKLRNQKKTSTCFMHYFGSSKDFYWDY
jgi:hypothetical protein